MQKQQNIKLFVVQFNSEMPCIRTGAGASPKNCTHQQFRRILKWLIAHLSVSHQQQISRFLVSEHIPDPVTSKDQNGTFTTRG